MIWLIPLAILAVAYCILLYNDWQEKRAQREADIIYRAESQHARLMSGDENALFGDYPPADL